MNTVAETGRLRVLVALPAGVAQWGLRSMLQALPNVGDVACSDEHPETVRLLGGGAFDVALVPADLPDDRMTELSALGQRHNCKVVVLLRQPSASILSRVAVRRADGFLLETDLNPESLADALESTRRGDIPMPRVLTQKLLSMNGRPPGTDGPTVALTPREEQTLTLLVEGCSNRQIGQRLGISENGAKRHVAHVLAKLNSPNRTMAVSLALRQGLVRKA